MPPTPVNDHTDEFEQLAGLAALDILEGDELHRFEEHAAGCERCRLMVRLDKEALAMAAPEMEPSADFKSRLMARAAAELGQQPDTPTEPVEPAPEPIPMRRENVVPFWRRSPWVSAVAAVLVLGLVVGGGYAYQNQVVASYPLTGSVPGSAVVNVRRSGASELEMRGVQDPPPGHIYEAWIIPPNGQPVAAGATSTGSARLPLEGLGSGATVAITQEQQRVDAPTSAPILAGMVS